MRRKPVYMLVNYVGIMWALCLLTVCPWWMPEKNMCDRLNYSAAVVLAAIAVRLCYVQEEAVKAQGSEITWLDWQMLVSVAFVFGMTALQIISDGDNKLDWAVKGTPIFRIGNELETLFNHPNCASLSIDYFSTSFSRAPSLSLSLSRARN